ncbi:hypothetical protein H072_8106 [Dactylellina haptotyla CBS 200.50]|uniref:Uncharacterized protein n=1 Tax=Dactylellina haptotyla (strain CBS 200.50) TaxID=1284197 RepID=S8AB70_DACHA|nr:hypothetical protein H072_8106 [Dactylellina haptotyla CBS 200.50]
MSSSKPMLPFLAELLTATAASYVLSQALKAYTNQKPFLETFDIPAFTDFILFNLFKVPVSTAWNTLLDDIFDEKKPAKKLKEKDEKNETKLQSTPKINWKVVVYKLVLNQTFYSMFINASIIAFMSFRRRSREGTMSWDAVYSDLERGFIPLYKDALKLWPIVNLVAFACFDTLPRMRFLTAVNLVWSIYLILMVT